MADLGQRECRVHRPCMCEQRCGDVDEPEDGPMPWPICKGLPQPPTDYGLRIVMVHRDELTRRGQSDG